MRVPRTTILRKQRINDIIVDDRIVMSKVGRGMWTVIHTNALLVSTIDDVKHYILNTLNKDIRYSVCSECRIDTTRWINNVMLPYLNTLKNVDAEQLFRMTVDFHNYVNRKLGKSEITYKHALRLYIEFNDLIRKRYGIKKDEDCNACRI